MSDRKTVNSPARQRPARSIAGEPLELGAIIARRAYRIGKHRVLAELGTPQRTSWKRDWYCAFRISHRRQKKVDRAFGVDALQALELATQLLKHRLEALSPSIRWEDGEPGNVFIDKTIPAAVGFTFAKQLEQRVDAAIRAELRRRQRNGSLDTGPRRAKRSR